MITLDLGLFLTSCAGTLLPAIVLTLVAMLAGWRRR